MATAPQSIDGQCPSCQAPLASGAVLCVQCGYHLQSGKKLAVETEPTMTVVRDPANPFRSPTVELDDSETSALGTLRSLFSVRGRIPRGQWWLWQLVFFVQFIVMGRILKFQILPEAIPVVSIWIFFWLNLRAHIRRWHDIDRSGFWTLVNLIPFGSLYTMIELGCQIGTEGDNEYGPDPLGRRPSG